MVAILPKLAPSGYKVIFMKLLDGNPDKYNYLDQVRMFDMIITLSMHLDGTNEGFHTVFDFAGSSFTHLLKFVPSVAKRYMFYVQVRIFGVELKLLIITILFSGSIAHKVEGHSFYKYALVD